MPPNRGATSTTAASTAGAVNTAYALSLLSEYAYTLDALPLELSRTYADLRELDAVLSSQLAAITAKVQRLTAMVEAGTAPGAGTPEARLHLLAELADDAGRLHPGGEDKIRVACTAADALRAHALHLSALMDHAPGGAFDAAVLSRRTAYPHVAVRTFAVPGGHERAGKRRAAASAAVPLAPHSAALDGASPAKRRRPAREDDDPSYGRSPRKERGGGDKPARNGARTKKAERAASPTESILSVASHLPAARLAATNGAARSGSAASNSAKRARPALETAASREAAIPQVAIPPPSAGPRGASANGADWAHVPLEGPGIPPLRGASQLPPNGGPPPVDDAEGDGDGGDEQDDGRLYCFCNGVSYGDMIGCDDANCEREWFHLACTGLEVAPAGTWYCSECLTRRNAAKRGGRGGKRKTGGGRSKDK